MKTVDGLDESKKYGKRDSVDTGLSFCKERLVEGQEEDDAECNEAH
jgi:hypothetical protein